jgi:acetyltransferase
MALVAEIEENGKKWMAGVVRVISDAWGESAEFAILVADNWQNQGLGTQMMDYMLEVARDKGISQIYASVLRTNTHMVRMFKERGFELKGDEDGAYYTSLDLEHAMPFVAELPFQPV